MWASAPTGDRAARVSGPYGLLLGGFDHFVDVQNGEHAAALAGEDRGQLAVPALGQSLPLEGKTIRGIVLDFSPFAKLCFGNGILH